VPVELRLDHRLTGRDQAGEVQHRVEAGVRREHGAGVADVGLHERGVRGDGLAEAGAEVVEHDDLVAGVQQQPAGDAADVAGASVTSSFTS
jgi:hypothetical protein